MGFLEEGAPLAWRASDRYRATVKRRGVREFLKLFRHFKDNQCDRATLCWGDELEFCLVKLDYDAQIPRLLLAAECVLDELRPREALLSQALSCEPPPTWRRVLTPPAQSLLHNLTSVDNGPGRCTSFSPCGAAFASSSARSSQKDSEGEPRSSSGAPAWQISGWHPEYGRHMVEAIPGQAFRLDLDSLFYLLPSMQIRRKKIQAVMPPGCHVVSLTSFPTMGALVSDLARPGSAEKPNASCDEPSRAGSGKRGSQPNRRAAVSAVPTLSPGDFASPPAVPDPLRGCSRSIFVGDGVIQKHPRFRTLTANIRERRGKKVDITVPLFQDVCTFPGAEGASRSGAPTGDSAEAEMPQEEELRRQLMMEGKALHDGRSIYMDHMAFGMGMHCVQATFGCPSLSDARYLYDQLGVLAPLWLSLTAATPFLRGLVAATDTRWATIAGAVDCRTEEEFKTLPKSRYGAFSLYIGDHAPLRDNIDFYNDVPAPADPRAYAALIAGGVDPILARHVAFLFVRDPLVIFRDKVVECSEEDEEAVRRLEAEAQVDWGRDVYDERYQTTADFENLQSTNWNSVRFKPPPSFKKQLQQAWGQNPNSGANEDGTQSQVMQTGDGRQLRNEGEENLCATVQTHDKSGPSGHAIECWRVEFRTPEIQLTDFENAACIALITVLVQVLLEERFDLYIPMSLNEENMRRSSQINSIMTQKFWFRKDIRSASSDRSFGEFYLHEILFGVPMAPGRQTPTVALVPACLNYMERKLPSSSPYATAQLLEFFDFIRHRSQGILPTNASFFRAYLAAHPDYKRDSVVSQTISFGVCDLAVKIGQGAVRVDELFGPFADRVGMWISVDGDIQTCLGVSRPVVTSDFPCPLAGGIASVREQHCDNVPAAEDSQAFVLGMKQRTPENPLGSNGDGVSFSPEEDCPCDFERTTMKGSLCFDSGLAFYLGGCVPFTLQKAWKGKKLKSYLGFRYGEIVGEVAKRDFGIQEDPNGAIKCEFPGSCRRPSTITNEDATWAWMLSTAVGGRDTDTGASDENGSTSCPSLGEICDIPDEAKAEKRYSGSSEQEGACSQA
ncbi:putative gamma-glutamylcysteine synthetase [Neospora caninum Liverpool]|uniref:glutamate--cysteine ligase n=1 Tax=Neospora caninum (strain Liverpool) TaxID=572307 RepID=F0VIA7_NEOCL|nr:putative gamma-glutamylcysteine synthetase [Neospora caninum Liverpool]CBZ53468.1 putative gamma-glutamylcysteine synthetase [Neospora caninum Liverpool]CEL67455.1 TPA: gamma-glutamylcysteine synthetase, putative [Neospora caninum Liverpool]|eukprot:XP_003883500.1 putative gamma-glutamylcysteine synthetase [Neospora caninum Liverpool]